MPEGMPAGLYIAMLELQDKEAKDARRAQRRKGKK
jgi:hypothetical protein